MYDTLVASEGARDVPPKTGCRTGAAHKPPGAESIRPWCASYVDGGVLGCCSDLRSDDCVVRIYPEHGGVAVLDDRHITVGRDDDLRRYRLGRIQEQPRRRRRARRVDEQDAVLCSRLRPHVLCDVLILGEPLLRKIGFAATEGGSEVRRLHYRLRPFEEQQRAP